jgi:hypothetical protein
MTTITGQHDELHSGAITRVVRVFWSRQRAWHGETVKACVRTELVPDGAAVEIRVLSNGNHTELAKLDGTLEKGKLDADWVVDLAGKPLPRGETRFVLEAKIGKLESVPSAPLVVDLAAPVFSL